MNTSLYCRICGSANAPDATTCFACGDPLDPGTNAPGSSAGPSTSGAVTAPLPPLQLLHGRYRLLRQIGQGGMGAVYQAEDTHLGNRLVAIKEMSSRGLNQEEMLEAAANFQREALLLAQLTHPNLPRIYEQFSEGNRWYLVMDFIEGETLEDYLAKTPGGRLAVSEVIHLGIQLATVLSYLHARRPPIIFRDLKPANIMLTPDRHLYLIDFGIARFFKPGQTKDTTPFGSSGYAAPEQYGKAQTTPQSDIYSLGATLHQLLSGTDPSQTPFVFAPLRLADLPELEALIFQMVEPNPEKRPASIETVRQELQQLALLSASATSLGLPTGKTLPRVSRVSALSSALAPHPAIPARSPLKRRLPRPSPQGIVMLVALTLLIILIPLTIPFLSASFSGSGPVTALAPTPTPTPSPTPTDTPSPTPTDTPTPSPTPVPFPSGKAAYLIDAGTNKALFSDHPNTRLPIASVTKIMTAVLAIEKGGDLAFNVAPVTQAELDEVPPDCTSAHLVAGDENMSLLHLLYGLMLQSGCDAAVVIAHHIAGSTKQFVSMMNSKAQELGLANTHFTSPHGEEPTNTSTVADLVKLARYAMTTMPNHQTFATIVGTTQHRVDPQTHRHFYLWDNTNQLLSTGQYAYPGANGVKTGFTDAAGYCLVFSASRNGRLLIGAVLGAGERYLLYRDAAELLDRGFIS